MTDKQRSPSADSPPDVDGNGAALADRIKEKGAEFSRRVVDAIDSKREGVARQLNHAAYRADQVSDAADRVADRLETMAEYVRDHQVRGVISPLRRLIRSHPGKSLLAAAAIGFLTGRALRHN